MPATPPIEIRNETRGQVLATQAELARSFVARGRGLMGRVSLPAGYALIIYPEWSIHTFFMRVPIDVPLLRRALAVFRCDLVQGYGLTESTGGIDRKSVV